MDMEERSFPRSGGSRAQQLSDLELIDVEHPQFINSSISDDEELGENNNRNNLTTTFFVPDSRKAFPIPISSVVPPKILPLPVSTSSSCFVANVLRSMQENPNVVRTTLDGAVSVSLESLQKKLSKTSSDGQREVLRKLQKIDEKRSEFMRLKENISKLETQKKTLSQEHIALVTKCAKQVPTSKEKLVKAQIMYKKGEQRLKDKTDAQNKLKEKLNHALSKWKEVSKEDAELYEWTQEHCITVHLKTSSDCSLKDEVVIELHNADPLHPERQFHVLAESVSLKGFLIGNVFPYFDEAYETIERGNESQDLMTLLRDCKRYWKRDCESSGKSFRPSVKLCESTKVQTMIADQTVELFNSPPVSNK